MGLFDTTTQALSAALGAANLRQQVLSNNLANADTPNFKRSDVNFQSALQSALTQADATGSQTLDFTPTVQQDTTSAMRADGNNVDVNVEMTNLAENEVQYNALVAMASKQMQMIQYEITGGQGG